MRVYVYPCDTEACGYYRLIWATMALKQQGHDVRILHPMARHRVVGYTDDQDQLATVNAPSDADVMVFQRVSSKMMVQAVPIWRANGIAVVADMDDDMSAVHPDNPAWQMLHPKITHGRLEEYSWHAVDDFCDAATYVTASTEQLRRKYGRDTSRSRVINNYVPAAVTDIVHTETPGLIGWGGNVRTHPNDPPVLRGALARMQRDGYDFKVVGPSVGVTRAFQLFRDAEITGGVSIDRWHHEIAKFAVGIAPLADTRFNHAKSWLKMLEYAAVGVPAVGSPLTEYRHIHQLGIGLLASTPREWITHMRRLLRDDQLRHDMSEAGRAIVREKLTIEANAWRWWEAWTEAFRIQRAGPGDPFRRPPKQLATKPR